LKKQWIPDQVRNDKNTNMRSFANYDTASLRLVVDFKTSDQAQGSRHNSAGFHILILTINVLNKAQFSS
jgi:hypothetical protein